MTPHAAPGHRGFYARLRLLGSPLVRTFFRLRAEGAGAVPPSGPCILAANHLSYLDPLVLAATCPRQVRFMMTRRFWEMPLVGWLSRRAGSFPVGTAGITPRTLRAALAVLEGGEVLGIFPEGGIPTDGRLRAGRPGAARLALRTGSPIVPAGIVGTSRALPKGHLLPRPVPVLVRYGEPVLPSGYAALPEDEREASLTTELMRRIAALAADPAP
jgi:1-acyl-sn-glycerol-3-phosphate acyltransferase